MTPRAGTSGGTPFLELGPDEWRDILEVDLTGACLAAQAAARRMVAGGVRGRIVDVTSATSTCRRAAPRPTWPPSTASAG